MWFDVDENIFDLHRGDSLPLSIEHLASSVFVSALSVALVQTSWAPSTRKLYHTWVMIWVRFCILWAAVPIPASRSALARFITIMSTMYASSTVHVAMSAIVGWHSLNDLQNPIRSSPMLARMWSAVRRVNGLGVRRKKAVCDHKFVANMYALWKNMRGLHTWRDIRTMAWFLVGWEAGLRVSEVRRLSVCCWIRSRSGHVDLKIIQAKNNRWMSMAADRARLVRATASLDDYPSAVRFIEEVWFPFLAARGALPSDWLSMFLTTGQICHPGCRFGLDSSFVCGVCPPLFPTFSNGFGVISTAHVSEMVKWWAQALGFDSKAFSGISFRRGSVSVAAAQKVSLELRMKQYRWLQEDTQHQYIDCDDAEKAKVGAALHKAVASESKVLSRVQPQWRDQACIVCGRMDHAALMLLCDNCDRGYHTFCLDPPLRQVPEGAWYCPQC